MVESSDSGRISRRVIVVQLVILAGVIGFLKFYLPRMEKAKAAAQLAERESRIKEFFRSATAAGSGGAAPRLRSTPSIEEVEQALGAPDTSSTDYAGGLHLTWFGARHSLEGSFDRGRLYALTLIERDSGQGITAMKSSAASEAD